MFFPNAQTLPHFKVFITCLAFWQQDATMYFVFFVFTSRPILY